VHEVRKERIYEKYAWILVGVAPVIFIISPIVGGYFIGRPHPAALKTITGLTLEQIGAENPRIVYLVLQLYRNLGLAWFALGFIGIAIAAFPFRKGLRFAWYVSWVWPAYLAGFVVSTAILTSQLGENSGMLASGPATFVVVLVIALLGQLLPVRKFFPKEPIT
jgi:hypothetical protein